MKIKREPTKAQKRKWQIFIGATMFILSTFVIIVALTDNTTETKDVAFAIPFVPLGLYFALTREIIL